MTANDDERRAQAVKAASCDCVFCLRDGPHEPDCGVHHAPPSECDCGRTEQAKGAS